MASTDEELVSRSMGGDLDSFNQLVLRWERPIYALAYRVIGREEDARDVAQETFLRAFRALSGFKGQAKFSSWLYRITRNRAVDLDRRRQVRPLSAGDEPLRNVSGGPEPEGGVDGWDVARALSRIPDVHREVLTLSYFEGLSQREISRRTGVPLGTIKSRTTAALKRLHRSLVNPAAEEAQRG